MPHGVSGVPTHYLLHAVTSLDYRYSGVQAVCDAVYFDPEIHQLSPTSHTADHAMQFAFAATHQAFHDAQLDHSLGEVSRSGVILATAVCDAQTLQFTEATY